MYTFSIKKKDGIKKIAIFWITRPIKFAVLEYSIYKFQNMKINYEIDILNKLKNYFKTKSIFDQDWKKIDDFWIKKFLTKNYIKNQIELIDNKNKKKQIKSLCDIEKFPFIYNSIDNSNPNFNHNIKDF